MYDSSDLVQTNTWIPKVCNISAFWAIFRSVGPLFYILLRSRYGIFGATRGRLGTIRACWPYEGGGTPWKGSSSKLDVLSLEMGSVLLHISCPLVWSPPSGLGYVKD